MISNDLKAIKNVLRVCELDKFFGKITITILLYWYSLSKPQLQLFLKLTNYFFCRNK